MLWQERRPPSHNTTKDLASQMQIEGMRIRLLDLSSTSLAYQPPTATATLDYGSSRPLDLEVVMSTTCPGHAVRLWGAYASFWLPLRYTSSMATTITPMVAR